ncbi:MAG: outer membrane protein transport protein [Syntrophaceae bacterium]|nr:outer membrane protein transport protein [Syntrophaceae bacterium]
MKCNLNMKRTFILYLLITLLIPSAVFGGGYGGFVQGAKSHAMGNAFVGLADNPTAVCINPAGIIQLDGTEILIGMTIVDFNGKYVSSGNAGINKKGDKASLKQRYQYIPNLYITHKVNDLLAIGLGEYSVYGSAWRWNNRFEGRYVPTGKEGTLITATVSPVIALKIIDGLSVGVGGRLQYMETIMENWNYIAPFFPKPKLKVKAEDYAVGWDVALLYKIIDDLSIGIHYRSKINHNADDVNFRFSQHLRLLQVRDTEASFSFNFPQNLTFGLAWSQGPVTFTLDGTWWNWSNTNKDFVIKFKDKVAFNSSITSPWNWNDSWSVGVGGEYKVNVLNRIISLRAGYMWDQCPIPDSTVSPPGLLNDFHEFMIGTGFPIGPFYTDLYFAYNFTKDREWNNSKGDYRHPGRFFSQQRITGDFEDYNTYLIGLDITYKF